MEPAVERIRSEASRTVADSGCRRGVAALNVNDHDLAVGSDGYDKVHARVAERREHWAVMAEYVRLHSDGFKELDGGGPTGFDKDDFQVTARVMSSPAAAVYQQLDLRVGYRVRLGTRRTLDTFLDLFNATDRANFVNPVGDRRNTADFLRLSALVATSGLPRQAQFGIRLGF